jgi:hypothetical protein
VWVELGFFQRRERRDNEIAELSFHDGEAEVVCFVPLHGVARWNRAGAMHTAPKAQEALLCDLIISAFSALNAVAETAPAVLAANVDGDAGDFFCEAGAGFWIMGLSMTAIGWARVNAGAWRVG